MSEKYKCGHSQPTDATGHPIGNVSDVCKTCKWWNADPKNKSLTEEEIEKLRQHFSAYTRGPGFDVLRLIRERRLMLTRGMMMEQELRAEISMLRDDVEERERQIAVLKLESK